MKTPNQNRFRFFLILIIVKLIATGILHLKSIANARLLNLKYIFKKSWLMYALIIIYHKIKILSIKINRTLQNR